MADSEITQLITDFKEGFQIPSYFSSDVIESYIHRGISYLTNLYSDADFVDDHVARGLLLDYCFYCYYHRENEFYTDCRNSILTWQMSFIDPGEDEEDETE